MASISGTFVVAAFLGGLFCRRLRTAAVIGGTVALLYAALVVIGLWHVLADANLPYVLGALTAFCLAIAAPAVLACYLRRGLGRVFNGGMTEAG